MRANYPFAAIVGQERLKDALLWLAVDPKLGGLLITGTRGTAKSTAARALAELLATGTPFVELPIGATEDRVVGTLDVRALLANGERRFEPGLLARADLGVLYIDEVNLLPDHLVDVLLDAAAMGQNVVERDGASFTHDARIMLVGSMNPEEGELRPQLLDRFGLCVAVENDADLERRAEITTRRMQFEIDPAGFCARYDGETHALRERLRTARGLLPSVSVDRMCMRRASQVAIDANVEGMRADLTIVRAARAIAALDGRGAVTLADIERAVETSLAHRRREPPPQPPAPRPPRGEQPQSNGSRSEVGTPGREQEPVVFDVGALLDVQLGHERAKKPQPALRGIARATTSAVGPIAAIATVRTAAFDRTPSEHGALRIEEQHLRYVLRRGRERQLVIFVVDASGSMAAAARMRAAKGAVCALLEDAYHRRDAVALIAFRGENAQMVVPPTRSAVLAYRQLRAIATGGRTPLAAGLRAAAQTATTFARRDRRTRSHIVLVSDARANVPQHGAFDAALEQASALRRSGVRALCIDTESGRIRVGNAAQLASAMGASYRHVAECTDRTLGAAVREWMAIA